ncbi:MBL fold metallo-hydrolase [Nocardia yamanashiensis]|uniref:MBL fold metallo-hydrolase n=1 Tax=Nocardia yamanashiensis TaxID=209247 RepID=UPI001E40C92A|nr:MBL fold metallo-hydrolase [Nocardia yamanashiensis]UGT44090.1 MBL fold metallo-hydrolase [Nocardia yamanashiensis]
MTGVKITHIGGPTVLIEVDGWTILTDPTFDAPGRRYGFGLGTHSVKTGAPALTPADLPALDAVLLSHDHHADNLDAAGRRLLDTVPVVLTTVSGGKRLGLAHARGLRPWERTTLSKPGTGALEVIATPSRHGPPLSRPLVGQNLGFGLQRPGEQRVAVWMSGDSVLYRGLLQVARRLDVDIALLHLGAVRFGLTGPLKYTMDARDAARFIDRLAPRVAVPVHYEGWSHFSEGYSAAQALFARQPPDIRRRVRWLELGEPVVFQPDSIPSQKD